MDKTEEFQPIRKALNQIEKGIGSGWTRTNGDVSRGIYSPLQLPLCDTPLTRKKICWLKDLNHQPPDYKSGALPIEPSQHSGEEFINLAI